MRPRPPTAIAVAAAFVGKRETAGKNRAPWIDAIVREFHGSLGDPYCAYGVSHAFKASGADPTFPYGGGSQAIKRAFEAAGKLSRNVQDLLRWQGALFGWTNVDDPSHGHIGLVEKRFTDHGKILAIGNIEFNTDGIVGDRDGDGCYRMKRALRADGQFRPVTRWGTPYGAAHTIWFCDTSDIEGGAWWTQSC